ncbi:MAG TPA: iron ABC transporter permease [Syntrophomonadaceae bacterium]|nr:iron ABC transporter permease [Syntrophomonadaceae bacterium]
MDAMTAREEVKIERTVSKNKIKCKHLGSKIKSLILWSLPVLIFFIVLTQGRYPLSPSEIVILIYAKIFSLETSIDATTASILFDVRLPRILAAMLIGTALSVSGTAYQGIFKNPLVSPDILGVSAGAGFGAALAIMFSLGMWEIHLMSFAFGILAVVVTYAVSSRVKSGENTIIMVLAGILVGTIFTSLISFIKCVADPFNKLPAITFWLMGGLTSVTFDQLKLIIIPMIIGIVPLYILRWRLNVLSLGEEEAQSLGVNTSRLKGIVIISATLLTAAAVSVSGIIGWIGLVIPHLCRALVGPNYKILIPVSIVVGSSFLLVVDTLARVIMPLEIPLGILTSLIGAPFFMYLITRTRRGWK